MRRTPIARGTARLARAARLRPVNPRRRAKRQAQQFGPLADWIRTRSCVACFAEPPSDPHHVRSRGSGGKASKNLVPLCRSCHQELHRSGRKTFEARRGIVLAEQAEAHDWIYRQLAANEENR